MRKIAVISLFIFLSVAICGCNEDNTGYNMARFDRTYIPSLVLTAKKDPTGQSILAISRLKQDWELLKSINSDLFMGDGLMEIDRVIERANMDIATGDYKAAHMGLERIRDIMHDMRKQRGIDYFVDYLNEFHSVMETMVSALSGKQSADLTEGDIKIIWNNLPEARAKWQAVKNAKFERETFIFTKETAEVMRQSIKQQEKNIDILEAAIVSRNKKLIYKHTIMIKKGYSDIFKMFGNFDSVSL